jgi:hypothetical protein
MLYYIKFCPGFLSNFQTDPPIQTRYHILIRGKVVVLGGKVSFTTIDEAKQALDIRLRWQYIPFLNDNQIKNYTKEIIRSINKGPNPLIQIRKSDNVVLY